MLSLFFLLQAVPAGPPAPSVAQRYDQCVSQATADPAAGERDAAAWRMAGGGFLARQCLGLAYAAQQRWEAAAGAFEEAARDAELARDVRSARYWAQAGNAWLAAGDATKAQRGIDAALVSGNLKGLELGEAHLDRARVLVAQGRTTDARADLDRALEHAKDDPLAWLLSATLARRTGDLARAKTDIAQALERSADDASVQLEAGNIAAVQGDAAGARAAWTQVSRLSPGSPQARAAEEALAALGASTAAVPQSR